MKKLDPERLGKLLAVGGGILSLAVAAVSLLRSGQSAAEDEEQEDYTAPVPGTKSYSGYVPTGCRACGGNYPMCRLGCPVFDED